jgi:hypothetical protein
MNDATAGTIGAISIRLAEWTTVSESWDPVERAEEGNLLMTYLREQSVQIPADVRRAAVREMLTTMSIREVARELGLAPSRVVQIRDGR